jgi:hypothetical protein
LTTTCGPLGAGVDGQAANEDGDGLGVALGLGDDATGACWQAAISVMAIVENHQR